MVIDLKSNSFFNKETRISILVPEGWDTEVLDGSKFRLFGWPETGLEEYFDEYNPTMSYELTAPEFSSRDWFTQLVSQNNQEMQETYNQYELVNEIHCEIAGKKSYIKNYLWQEETTKLNLYQTQALIAASPFSLYVVNGAVVELFKDKYLPIFQQILDSTRIIPRT